MIKLKYNSTGKSFHIGNIQVADFNYHHLKLNWFRAISALILIILVLSFINITKAINNDPFAGGNGIPSDPYLISDCTQLQDIGSNSGIYLSNSFKLTQTIDCSDTINWNYVDASPSYYQGFMPIGTDNTSPFTGVFDGAGYSIENLYINSNSLYAGLFGYVNGGQIRNLNVTEASVESTGGYLAILAGFARNNSIITNVHTGGSVLPVAPTTYHISRLTNGTFSEVYKQGYPVQYTTKDFNFDNINGSLTLNIQQYGRMDFADVDAAILNACGTDITPSSATYVNGGQNVLDQISKIDENVILAHNQPFDVTWNVPTNCSTGTLELTANEYGPGIPMQFPSDGTVNYTLGTNSKTIDVDGNISETDGTSPSYVAYLTPSTGDPFGNAYMYFADDSNYLYITADITANNANDVGKDWFAVTVNGKQYMIDSQDSTYGICGFGMTSKASYAHATCEARIPKSLVGSNPNVSLSFTYYGTASYYYYGGLVGFLYDSTVTSSDSNADVTGDNNVGGLFGEIDGSTVTESHYSGNVTGSTCIGGLVAINIGDINKSYVTGQVNGDYTVGGLVANDRPGSIISDTYSTAVVNGDYTAPDSYSVGGLVGQNSGTISNSYASGDVFGNDGTGGLIGQDNGQGVTNSFSTSNITTEPGASDVGGFVGTGSGYNYNSGKDYWHDNQGVGVGDGSASSTQPIEEDSNNYFQGVNVHTKLPFSGWDFTNTWVAYANSYPDFIPITNYSLNYTVGANGSIIGNTSQVVKQGKSGTSVTATPNTGYYFIGWSDGVLSATRTDTDVQSDVNATANFAIEQFSLIYASGPNGSVSGNLSQQVDYGNDGSEVSATPAAGYYFTDWSDGVLSATRTDTDVQSDVNATASFAQGNVYIWSGAGTTEDWSEADNWLVNGSIPATPPSASDSVIFNNTGSKDVIINTPIDVNVLSIYQSYTGEFTINDDITIGTDLFVDEGISLPMDGDGSSNYNLTVGNDVNNSGTIANAEAITIGGKLINQQGGTIFSEGGDIDVESTTFNDTGSVIFNPDSSNINLHGLTNNGDIYTTDGYIQIAGNMINSGDMFTNTGDITIEGSLYNNIPSDNPEVYTGTSGNILIEGDVTNDGGQIFTGNDSLSNITFGGNLNNLDSGQIYSSDGYIDVSGSTINNNYSNINTTGTGYILFRGDLVNENGSYVLGAPDITVYGAVTNESGSEIYNSGTSGDIDLDSSVTNYGGCIFTTTNSGNLYFGGNVINSYDGINTTLIQNYVGNITVKGDFSNEDGAFLYGYINNFSGTWNFAGNFSNDSDSTVDATSGTWNILKNFDNENTDSNNTDPAFFASEDGTIVFKNSLLSNTSTNSEISGTTTFNNLSVDPGKTLTFQAETTQTINSEFNLTGSGGNLITIRSSNSPTQAYIDPIGSINASYVDVQDNDNLNNVVINPDNSVDSGNNTNWFNTNTITSSETGSGSISPSGNVSVAINGSQSFNISPESGSTIQNVYVDGVAIGPLSSYTFNDVVSSHTINVIFEAITYNLAISSGQGGKVTPNGSVSILDGGQQSITIAPDNGYVYSGYSSNGKVSCNKLGSSTICNVSSITSDQYFTANFSKQVISTPSTVNIYTEINTLGQSSIGGTITSSCPVSPSIGSTCLFAFLPATNYIVDGVTLDGLSIGSTSSYSLSNISTSHTLAATFIEQFGITYQSSNNVTINIPSNTLINQSTNYNFTLKADDGYVINNIYANGSSINDNCSIDGGKASCTLYNVSSNQVISASAGLKAGVVSNNISSSKNKFTKVLGVFTGLLSSTKNESVKIIKKTPAPVAYTFPWLLFILLALLAYSLARQSNNEIKAAEKLSGLIETDKNIAIQKENFLMLSSHYLRTPMTVIKGGVELVVSIGKLPDQVSVNIQKIVDSLDEKIKDIFKAIDSNAYLNRIIRPDVLLEKRRLIRSPYLWIPPILVGLVFIYSNFLFITIAKINVNIIDLLTEIVAFAVVVQYFIRFYRKRQLEHTIRVKYQNDLKEQITIDEARNDFMGKSGINLEEDINKFKEAEVMVQNKSALKMADKGVNQLKSLADKFVYLSDLQTGKINLNTQEFSIRKLINMVIEKHSDQINSKKLKIILSSSSDVITTDKDKLSFVLDSIIDNAIKFNKQEGKITVDSYIDKQANNITIEDNGIGIDEDAKTEMFKPFSRGTSALTFNYEGMGTNLYIAKVTANYLGGDIFIDSSTSKGTKVTLQIRR